MCLLVAAVALPLSPARTCAQTPGLGLELSLRPGVFLPATNLVESVEYFVPVTLDAALAFSADVAVRSASGLDFEWQVVNVPTRIRFESVAINGEVIRTPHAEDMGLWLVSGNVRWRLRTPMRFAEPFLIAGVGVVRWNSVVLPDGSVTDFTTNVGAGGYVTIAGPLSLRLDGRTYLSWFTPQDFDPTVNEDGDQLQAHFTLNVGLTLGRPTSGMASHSVD